jgi:Family of unknown function (DUF6157)
MKLHTTNYFNTFIEVAEDCPITVAEVPPQKEEKTIANLQYTMIHDHPYTYTSDDVLFTVYAERKGIPKKDYKIEREKFFSKGQPCLRSSALPKRYGWGVHSNEDGKLALVAVEDAKYKKLSSDKTVKHLKAMRSNGPELRGIALSSGR